MKRIKRMHKLVELAQADLEDAANIFQSLQNQFHAEQAQQEQLQIYLKEYLAQQTSGKGTSLYQLKTTNAFMDKLNKAIQQQQVKMDQLEDSIERARAQWVEKKTREQALVKLTEKMEKDYTRQLDKQEQKLVDELSSRRFSRHEDIR